MSSCTVESYDIRSLSCSAEDGSSGGPLPVEGDIGIPVCITVIGEAEGISLADKGSGTVDEGIGAVVDMDLYRHPDALTSIDGLGDIPVVSSLCEGGRCGYDGRSHPTCIGRVPQEVLSYGLQGCGGIILAIGDGGGDGRRGRLGHHLHGDGHPVALTASIGLGDIVGEGAGSAGIDDRLCGDGRTAGIHTVPFNVLSIDRDGISRSSLAIGDQRSYCRRWWNLLYIDLNKDFSRSVQR